jgi:hypothetical protein
MHEFSKVSLVPFICKVTIGSNFSRKEILPLRKRRRGSGQGIVAILRLSRAHELGFARIPPAHTLACRRGKA